MPRAAGRTGCLEWTMDFAPAPGELKCGDAFKITEVGGSTLLAVVDGLGHGPDAVESSLIALDALCACTGPLEDRVRRAHQELSKLRGAAAGVMTIRNDTRSLEWLGVGNVEAAVHQGGDSQSRWTRLFVQSGLVGQRLPTTLRVSTLELSSEGVVVITTDGIEQSLLDGMDARADPAWIVEVALSRHRVPHDDALVVAARWVPV